MVYERSFKKHIQFRGIFLTKSSKIIVNMKNLIEQARSRGIKTGFRVGGAVVTEAYASSNGASFAKDGVEAV